MDKTIRSGLFFGLGFIISYIITEYSKGVEYTYEFLTETNIILFFLLALLCSFLIIVKMFFNYERIPSQFILIGIFSLSVLFYRLLSYTSLTDISLLEVLLSVISGSLTWFVLIASLSFIIIHFFKVNYSTNKRKIEDPYNDKHANQILDDD